MRVGRQPDVVLSDEELQRKNNKYKIYNNKFGFQEERLTLAELGKIDVFEINDEDE